MQTIQSNDSINTLAQTIHEQSQKMGIYKDNPPSKVTAFLEMQLQLFKAYEARNQPWSATEKLIGRLELLMNDSEHPKMSHSTFQRLFKVYFENTAQAKIANCVMLLLDYAAYKALTAERQTSEYKNAKYLFADFKNILLNLNAALEFLYDMKVTTIEISDIIFYLEEFAKFNNFDLWQQVRFRIHYNNLNLLSANAKKNTLKNVSHE